MRWFPGRPIPRAWQTVWTAVRARPVAEIAFGLAVVYFASLLVAQARTLHFNVTPVEQHHWRQAFTYGVAWNFAHTSWDFFHPRMFLFVSGSNIVGMEAPLYPWLSALFFALNKDSTLPCRIISSLALLVLVFELTRTLFVGRPWARAGFLIATCMAPLAWNEFRQIQPDGMMVGLAGVSACAFVRFARHDRTRDLLLGSLFAMLAVLTKSAALGIFPALWLFATWGSARRFEWRFLLLVTLAFAPALAAYVAWDRWAVHLLHTYSKGVIVISIQHDKEEMLRTLRTLEYTSQLMLFFVARYAMSWWLIPAALVGITDAFSTRERRAIGVPMLAWFVVVSVMLLCFGDRLKSNWYYVTPLFPPLAYFAGCGLAALAEALDGDHIAPTNRFALLVLVPTLYLGWRHASVDTYDPAPTSVGAAPVMWNDALGFAMLALILAVSAGAMHANVPRRLPRIAVLFASVAFYLGAQQPALTGPKMLAYTSGLHSRGPYLPEMAALRAAIDKHSKTSDRVVVDETEIVYLYLTRRNGYCEARSTLNTEYMAAKAADGVRLFVHYKTGELPAVAADWKPLADSKTWSLYCLHEDGCGAP